MDEQTPNPDSKQEEPFDWGSLFRRKQRPLPKPGCSWAFYIFLVLLLIFLVAMFLQYKGVQ